MVCRFPYQDEKNWLESIKSGLIKVNNKKVSAHRLLKNRDIISYERLRSQEPDIDTRYRVLHLDDSILVVEKNGNIPVTESGRYYQNTLLNILKEREGFPELYAAHRLDKETSGVLVIARTSKVAAILGDQFAKRIPEKTYQAVLVGEFSKERFFVDQPIKKTTLEESRVRIRQIVNQAGKPAQTLFVSRKALKGLTLAKIRAFSGRTHQIRCHAEHIGYPILGDKLYGQSDKRFLEFLNGSSEPVFPPFGKITRQLLHASSISFSHPETGKKVSFESDHKLEFARQTALSEWLDEL